MDPGAGGWQDGVRRAGARELSPESRSGGSAGGKGRPVSRPGARGASHRGAGQARGERDAMSKYDHRAIESKWQDRWEKARAAEVDVRSAQGKYYMLMMF